MAVNLIDIGKHPKVSVSSDAFVTTLNGDRCLTKENLLKEMAVLFNFPKYFDHNFDALFDCMQDLDGVQANHIFLIVINNERIGKDELNSDCLTTFCLVMQQILKTYVDNTKVFNVVSEKSFLKKINPLNLG